MVEPKDALISFDAELQDAGTRLDLYISSKLSLLRSDMLVSRNRAQKMIESGDITVNGVLQSKNYMVRKGDRIIAVLREPESLAAAPQALDIDIVYEDEVMAVVNKPRGMVVHPAAGNADGTLVNALLYHMNGRLSGIGGVIRPGIVHRIDKNTSGLLIVAKTDKAHISLSAQIKSHSFKRLYRAVVCGKMKADCGRIDKPIGRDERNRKRMAAGSKISKPASTLYRVIGNYPASNTSYIELELLTGRTHQIRAHMAYLGHPVLGDALYGGERAFSKKLELNGQCLHAKYIAFEHPSDGRHMEFDSALPEYFIRTLDAIENKEK